MKNIHTILVLFIVFIINIHGFSKPDNQTYKFCVLSDIHYYDTTLGISSAAFQKMTAREGKMFTESGAIIKSALQGIQSETPAFLIISGDLTKDGEKVGHESLASIFFEFENSTGIKIFVIPGNHDIMNGHAKDFSGDSSVSTPSITPQEFSAIYNEFGFNEAIAKDDNSLSYIAEPVPGMWLFALDACRYKENTPEEPVVGGKFTSSTLSWIESKLQEARILNKTVIGMMHHGLLEHFEGQKQFFNEFVVDDFNEVSKMFAASGLKIVFTGHYHATDITEKIFPDGSFIYDIETGSLASYPSSYRTVTLNQDLTAEINTTRIKEINHSTGDKDFLTYAEDLFDNFFSQLVAYKGQLPVESGGYGLTENDALKLAAIETDAFKAHYTGDELPDQITLESINKYLISDIPAISAVGSLMKSLCTDLAPTDNSAIIDLKSNYTDVDRKKIPLPSGFNLEQNYPNPFNPVTIIGFQVADFPEGTSGFVVLKVFDVLGKVVATLVNENKAPGYYEVEFSAESDGVAGNLAGGVYFYRLQAGNIVQTKKLVLLK